MTLRSVAFVTALLLASTSARAAAQVADTARPAVPTSLFGFPRDTLAYPLTHVDSSLVYYRTVVAILFDSTATGSQVRGALAAHDAKIIGGTALGSYIVRIPDPGPLPGDLWRTLAAIKAEPGVQAAYPRAFKHPVHIWLGRPPPLHHRQLPHRSESSPHRRRRAVRGPSSGVAGQVLQFWVSS